MVAITFREDRNIHAMSRYYEQGIRCKRIRRHQCRYTSHTSLKAVSQQNIRPTTRTLDCVFCLDMPACHTILSAEGAYRIALEPRLICWSTRKDRGIVSRGRMFLNEKRR